MVLPGVGIFGSDPISKVLIQLLQHFEFEIFSIWTNHYEIDSNSFVASSNTNTTSTTTTTPNALNESSFSKLITTSIDNVLLNKNINLIFVCCQPNLHSKICLKALGIGKNVICLFPTCKDLDSIYNMINSARYYPSLTSSINYGGLRFLSEFKLIKQYMSYIGDIKLCNIVINCQNISIVRQNKTVINNNNNNNNNSNSNKNQGDSLTNLIDNIALVASHSTSDTAANWLSDRDLGAGVLNRYGAAMISLMLHLFEDKKVTKVYGSLKTFIDDFDNNNNNKLSQKRQNSLERIKSSSSSDRTNSPVPVNNLTDNSSKSSSCSSKSIRKNQIRRITADDHCTFQMRLDSKSSSSTSNKSNNSIMVTVVINSLAHCKYSQELVICGNEGAIEWKNNSSIYLKSNSNNNKINEFIKNQNQLNNNKQLDDNNNNVSNVSNGINDDDNDEESFIETELKPMPDIAAEKYLKQFQNLEYKYPELPLLYIRGLYYYLAHVKNSFQEKQKETDPALKITKNNIIDNFEHTNLVQSIIKNISLSNESNRWVPVNY